MTELTKLINSLITVIIRYHDAQLFITKLVTVNKDQSQKQSEYAYAHELFADKKINLKTHLEHIIDSCKDDRKPLMHYLLHEIMYLKALSEIDYQIAPETMERCKRQVIQMLNNCQTLLKLPQGKTSDVVYSRTPGEREIKISLAGLINESYFGGSLCNSGIFLKEELDKFFLLPSTTAEEIVNDILVQHQSPPIINAKQTEIEKLKAELAEQKRVLELQAEEKAKIELELKSRDKHIGELRSQISLLTHPIEGQARNRNRFHSRESCETLIAGTSLVP